jgi:aminopeptidase N
VKGLKDDNPRVRRAVVAELGEIKTNDSYKALKTIAEKGDPAYTVEAAALRSIGNLATAQLGGKSKEDKVIKIFKSVLKDRDSWNEMLRSGAIAGLSRMKTSAAALDLILDSTAIGTPQALRLAAIRSLGAIAAGQSSLNLERILERLDELSHESFFLTQVAVVVALGQMETMKAVAILQGLADRTPDGRVRRIAEEAVQRVQKAAGTDKSVKQMREEIDQLKQTNQELLSRLESLEAKAKG